MPRSKPCRRLALILGDQLDRSYPAKLGLEQGHDAVLMVEIKGASESPPSHIQRTVLFLSAMRHHAEHLRDTGWRVEYVKITDTSNTHSFQAELSRAIARLEPASVVCIEPGAWSVRDEIEAACDDADTEFDMREDPHFLCDHGTFEKWARGRKQLTMEYFYREQRRRLGILMDGNDEPEGGEWNFDKQNRRAFKTSPDPPPIPAFPPDDITKQVIKDVQKTLPGLPGNIDAFSWPVSREQAVECLDDFIANRLRWFGDYQDAMWTGQHSLFHSVISPAMNLKLLDPREVCRAAVGAYETGQAPINSVEGFVRQIIGWREFIRGIYYHEGPGYDQRNELNHHGSLPDFYWTADTDMKCMSEAVSSVVDRAHGHHIERLMITGNFALIAGIHPTRVHEWYLGMYADAVDWVTAPNTVGMALHADGGVVGTKPYAASANYINKMSNHCKHCRYTRSQRSGEDACPFNVFYWDFLLRHEDRFKKNNRMPLILKNVEKIGKEERVAVTSSAKAVRERLGISDVSGQA